MALKSRILELTCDSLVCIIFYVIGLLIHNVVGDKYLYFIGFIMGLISAVLFITIGILLKLITEAD